MISHEVQPHPRLNDCQLQPNLDDLPATSASRIHFPPTTTSRHACPPERHHDRSALPDLTWWSEIVTSLMKRRSMTVTPDSELVV